MKKNFPLALFTAGSALVILFFIWLWGWNGFIPDFSRSMLAGFFAEKLSAEKIKGQYSLADAGRGGQKVKILLVPGHDENSPGASFHDLREVDMTTELGENLHALFKDDSHYDAVLLRGKDGYNTNFIEYFKRERENIARFGG